MAVMQRRGTIKYINNPVEEVQLVAVERDGFMIQFIDNPTTAVKLAAVKQNGFSILFINHPDQYLIKLALTNPECIAQSQEYEAVVKKVFANNALLAKKWIRYGIENRT